MIRNVGEIKGAYWITRSQFWLHDNSWWHITLLQIDRSATYSRVCRYRSSPGIIYIATLRERSERKKRYHCWTVCINHWNFITAGRYPLKHSDDKNSTERVTKASKSQRNVSKGEGCTLDFCFPIFNDFERRSYSSFTIWIKTPKLLPKLVISSNMLNAVYRISEKKRDAHQAACILKHHLISSMKKIRILEQLWFIKNCISNQII